MQKAWNVPTVPVVSRKYSCMQTSVRARLITSLLLPVTSGTWFNDRQTEQGSVACTSLRVQRVHHTRASVVNRSTVLAFTASHFVRSPQVVMPATILSSGLWCQPVIRQFSGRIRFPEMMENGLMAFILYMPWVNGPYMIWDFASSDFRYFGR